MSLINEVAMYEDNRGRETPLIKTVLIKTRFYSRGWRKIEEAT